MQTFVDYYKVLGLSPKASPAEIKQQYRHLAMTNHPDRGGSELAMQKINNAHSMLADPAMRAKYDELYREFYQPGRAEPTTPSQSANSPVPPNPDFRPSTRSSARRRREVNVKYTFLMRVKFYLKYQLIMDLAWLLLKLLYGIINVLRELIFG